MGVIARIRQGLEREVVGIAPRIELVKAQVNRICPRRNRGMKALQTARRSQKLWLVISFLHYHFPVTMTT